MKEHLMTQTELRATCPYCSRDVRKEVWESKHDDEIHYKQTSCRCGKSVWIRVDFHGSGHDSWDSTKNWVFNAVDKKSRKKSEVKTLESRIKLIKEVEEKTKGIK